MGFFYTLHFAATNISNAKMKIDPIIFNSVSEIFSPKNFNACLNVHGLYSTERFVLRLSPRNHELIAVTVDAKTLKSSELSNECLQAISTYLHETIHWWQHKGSTSGYLRSALYLSKTHDNLHHISELSSLVGPKKPIFKWWHIKQQEGSLSGTEIEKKSNTIVNNFLDASFYINATHDPELLKKIAINNYFECQAHSYFIAYDQVLNDLHMNIDSDNKILPNNNLWESKFLKLRQENVRGHYHGSPIDLAPLGMLQILEGQARFIQLQFLSFSKSNLTLNQVRTDGFLAAPYGTAFDIFLKLTRSEEPEYINSPQVALFLLICDIAINPSSGFPFDISSYENFHLDNDPGYRFMMLCVAVDKKLPNLKNSILDYSKSDFISASDALCMECGFDSPINIFKTVAEWENKQPLVKKLMDEHKDFKFGPPNPATRILLSEFIAFAKDKLDRPDFFCWPGAWLAGSRTNEDIQNLWLNHLALFSDTADSQTIVARKVNGRENKNVNTAFQNFYVNVMTCDMMHQWVLSDGQFKLKYDWLSEKNNSEKMEQFARELFFKQFNIRIEDFHIVS